MRHYFLYFFLLLCIVAFVSMGILYKSEAHRFFGIANSDSIEINYPYALKIENLYVKEGQSIRKGELLATFLRKDLTLDKKLVNNKVQTYKAEENLKVNQLKSTIKSLALEYKVALDNINFEIKELQRKEKINQQLLASISTQKPSGVSPLLVQLKQLRLKKKNLKTLYVNQKNSLSKELKNYSLLFAQRGKSLNTELKSMKGEEKALKVFAPFDGIVSILTHKVNEDIQPFEMLMTLNNRQPTYVKGYISIENKSQVRLGQEVQILAIAEGDRNVTLLGKIRSFSSNVVSYPARLKRYQNVNIWGVEVVIDIPKNQFILGEKVIILNDKKESSSKDKLINYFYQARN